MSSTDLEIDARGLRCPLPVVKMEAALRRLSPGQKLKITADDPIAAVDLPHFANEGHHQILRLPLEEAKLGGSVCVFIVTRAENP